MSDQQIRTIVIRPSRGWLGLNFRELWMYRELLYFLTWRDVKVRYKQTVLGAGWAIIQPLLLMVVFSIFLGRLAGVPSDDVPYPIFVYTALVPWTLFAQSLAGSSNSVVGSSNLVSKAYFPRLVLPLAATGSYILDFVIAMAVLVGMMFFYGMKPTPAIVWLPALMLLAVVTALAVGTWLAALNVRYRDVRYAVPFLVQLWLFATPVAYPSSMIPEGWRLLFGMNPMAGVVEGFRWSLLGTETRPGALIALSATVTIVVLLGGVAYFRRLERTFADVI